MCLCDWLCFFRLMHIFQPADVHRQHSSDYRQGITQINYSLNKTHNLSYHIKVYFWCCQEISKIEAKNIQKRSNLQRDQWCGLFSCLSFFALKGCFLRWLMLHVWESSLYRLAFFSNESLKKKILLVSCIPHALQSHSMCRQRPVSLMTI